jgi:hypothetical protein
MRGAPRRGARDGRRAGDRRAGRDRAVHGEVPSGPGNEGHSGRLDDGRLVGGPEELARRALILVEEVMNQVGGRLERERAEPPGEEEA